MDYGALKQRGKELQELTASIQNALANHLAKTLPSLYQDISELQATAVLLADCDEKIARQKQYAQKHDSILNHLLR